MKRKPIVAIVGRPNVGKSTLTNRFVGSRRSIVDDMPGVTRDRIYFDVEWQGKAFTIIDTGGIIPNDDNEIMNLIYSQAKLACEEADKIVFLVDGKDGITPVDEDIANILRQSKKPVILAVNKIDSQAQSMYVNEFYALSMGEPIGLSASHGSGGVGDLLEAITKDFEENIETEENSEIKLAIVGRPNAGKSSIVNALLGKERVIVSNVSGTTRDSIDTNLTYKEQDYIIIDTAGIRKKSKVDYGVEQFAVDRALNSIRECDIAILVLDAVEGIADQDKKIASIITEAGKGMIIAINKWDLVEDKKSNTINKFEQRIANEIPFLNYVPKIYISAVTHQRLNQIFTRAVEVNNEHSKRVSTGLLNKVVNEAYALNPPQTIRNKRLKIMYSTQVSSEPPTFVLFVNDEKLLKDHYKRYMENKLREAFGFFGTPIRISVRTRSEKKN